MCVLSDEHWIELPLQINIFSLTQSYRTCSNALVDFKGCFAWKRTEESIWCYGHHAYVRYSQSEVNIAPLSSRVWQVDHLNVLWHSPVTEWLKCPLLTSIYSNWLALLSIIQENDSAFRNDNWKPGEWYPCTWFLDCLSCSSDDLWGKVMTPLFHGGAGWCELQLMLSEEADSSVHRLPLSHVAFAAAQ